MSVVRVDFFFYGTTHMFKILHWRTSSKEFGNNLDDLSTYTLRTAKGFGHHHDPFHVPELRGRTRSERRLRALSSGARLQGLSRRLTFQKKNKQLPLNCERLKQSDSA